VLAFANGLVQPIEPLISRDWVIKDYKACGMHLYKGILIGTVFNALMLVLCFNLSAIIVGLGIEPRVAEVAQRFYCWTLPYAWT
jgi:Na+-driven multidrug efflux pump